MGKSDGTSEQTCAEDIAEGVEHLREGLSVVVKLIDHLG
jgi:hypothetical protein